MTVYVLTDGSYSDYHIIGVTLDEATAEQFAKIHQCEIETFETDKIKEWSTKAVWRVDYRSQFDGKTVRKVVCAYLEENIDYSDEVLNELRVFNFMEAGYDDERFYMYAVAETKEQAIKIFTDKVAEYKAKEAGI